jgi:hypothetical protein
VAVAFDTLTYARRLREVGVPQEQAEAHAEALAAAVTETLATKHDVRELAAASKDDFQQVRQEIQRLAAATKGDLQQLAAATKSELRELAATTKQDMRDLELRLSIRFGGMLGVGVVTVAALVKLL